MVSLTYVDAFSDGPFTGNPAAVCLLRDAAEASWMQRVAAELNLAETAFVVRRPDQDFDLRWFAPAVEVDLCGHATLASAHVLWETGTLQRSQTARFHTRSGLLTATMAGDWIELDFPSTPPKIVEAPVGLLEAVGVTARAVGRSPFDYLIEVADEATVAAAAPDFAKLKQISTRGVMVTARSANPDYDFVSRFFAPGAGIDEDPATGSAHCCLAPFWQGRLGKNAFVARQLSRRGATIKVAVAGDRIKLAGQAVTMVRGELAESAIRHQQSAISDQ
jgi:PhzF family phenazine biosynthesis protein